MFAGPLWFQVPGPKVKVCKQLKRTRDLGEPASRRERISFWEYEPGLECWLRNNRTLGNVVHLGDERYV
jgi:hypothetical protein